MNQKPLTEDLIASVSQTFKALSDPTRIKILHLLFHEELSVNEISKRLDMQQSTISHQLIYLKQLRLVKNKRVKTKYFYSPDDYHVMNLLEQAIDHVTHTDEEGK